MGLMPQSTTIGFTAEWIAAQFLKERGYAILDRNYRKPWGEIDIIAQKGGIVVFAEVKANAKYSANFNPELRADWSKLRKVTRTARTYLADKKFSPEQEWQIDIISVVFDKEQKRANIKHFKNVDI